MILVRKWMVQAEAYLCAAKDSCDSKHYNWSCFQAQQSAEKALKAYLYSKGYTSVITHSIKELLRECEKIEKKFKDLKSDAILLDTFYISTRYPNGLGGELAPSEYYEKEDAQKCLNSAESILNNVRKFSKI